MTAEEKAFRDKIDRVELEELMYDEFYELIAEAIKIGYEKATRWRDQKEELPEKAGCDFCRDEQGYTIGNMYVCDKCGRQVP